MPPRAEALTRLLKDVFGLSALRPGQREVIGSVLRGRHTLAIMPSGGGKSLCYQLPAVKLPGTTIVISPLISLMKDQTDKLRDLGIRVAQLNSSVSQAEQHAALIDIETERALFVFTTPERVSTPEFLETIKSHPLDMVVIDEAHCISQWGHDFRPAYLEIKPVLRQLGFPTVLALTATATDAVIDDIRKQLGLPDMAVIHSGLYRGNLEFEVVPVTNEEERRASLLSLVSDTDGVGIVYTATVRNTGTVADFLEHEGFDVVRYHGRMSAGARKDAQDRFMGDRVKAVVATNAFGMGIDKPDIRFVAHYNVPGSPEAYYQECGRAGRDGGRARCRALYALEDQRIQQYFLGGRYIGADDLMQVHAALAALGHDHSDAGRSELQAALSSVPKNRVQVALSMLTDNGLVKRNRRQRFRVLRDRLPREEADAMAAEYRDRRLHDEEKLRQMAHYCQSVQCRWKTLLEYFDEDEGFERCGICDNCRHPPAAILPTPERHEPDQTAQASEPLVDLKEGDPVRLPKNRKGTVESINGNAVQVYLQDGSRKRFHARFVKKAHR